MERLTDKAYAKDLKADIERCKAKGYLVNNRDLKYVRLAAYEDTGLEPEEVLAMIKEVLKFEEIRDSIEKCQDTITSDDVISRNAAIRACKEWLNWMGIDNGYYRLGLIIGIKYLYPANQLHAKWVRRYDGFPVCSNCGKVDSISDDDDFCETPYCMWCGAKMK